MEDEFFGIGYASSRFWEYGVNPSVLDESTYLYCLIKLVNDSLVTRNIIWDPKAQTLSGLIEAEDEILQEFQLVLDESVKRVWLWHKKRDRWLALIFVSVYVVGLVFYSALLEQTHGWVNVSVMVLGFLLLFIPWWIVYVKTMVYRLVGEP